MEKIYGLIYKIINNVNGKSYIGQTRSHYKSGEGYKQTGIMYRWKQHKRSAKIAGTKYVCKQCRVLNNAIRKYGEEKFTIIELHRCSLEKLDIWEAYFITKYNTLIPNGYNMREGGMTGSPSIELRKHLSRKTKEYFSSAHNKQMQSKLISNTQIKEMIKELYVSNIERIEIKPIKQGEKYKIVYMYVKFKDISQRRRYRFGGIHISFEKALKKAIKVAKFVADENTISISSEITTRNNPLAKYQEKINKLRLQNIQQIRILPVNYKTFIAIRVYTRPENAKYSKNDVSTCFGGKNVPFKQAVKLASLFSQAVATNKTKWVISDKLAFSETFKLRENPKVLTTKS